jgi:hypothetical protein
MEASFRRSPEAESLAYSTYHNSGVFPMEQITANVETREARVCCYGSKRAALLPFSKRGMPGVP